MTAGGGTRGRAVVAAGVVALAAGLAAAPAAPAIDPDLLPAPVCASASARWFDGGLPAPRTAVIEPGRGMGGVALGAPARALVERWGVPFEDGADGTFWMAGRLEEGCEPHARGTYAIATVAEGRVGSLAILRGRPDTLDWRTPEGIGLGSRAGAVRRAYPAAVPDDAHAFSAGSALVLDGPGAAVTVFRLAGPRVWAISVALRGG